MKKVIESIGLIILSLCLTLFTACEKEKVDYDTPEGEGQISFASFSLTIDATEIETKAVTEDDCVVKIYKEGALVEGCNWKYKDMPKIVTLAVGTYQLKVESGILLPGGWEALPYCEGEKEFSIEKNKVTDLDKITCTLQNVKISLSMNIEDLAEELQPGYTVQINNGSTGFLTYTEQDIKNNRFGYLAAPKASNTFTVVLAGKRPDGNVVRETQNITNVRPGEWHKIKVSVSLTGTISVTFKIKSEMEVISSTIKIPVTEDIIKPDPTPDPNPTPDPTPDPEPGNAPSVTGQGFDMRTPITLNGSITSIVVNLSAPNKIKELNVRIQSKALEGLVPEKFNLVDEEMYKQFGPEGLGLIQESPLNKTQMVFDITQFISMLSLLGADTHKFVLEVVDQNGLTASETLTLITL